MTSITAGTTACMVPYALAQARPKFIDEAVEVQVKNTSWAYPCAPSPAWVFLAVPTAQTRPSLGPAAVGRLVFFCVVVMEDAEGDRTC